MITWQMRRRGDCGVAKQRAAHVPSLALEAASFVVKIAGGENESHTTCLRSSRSVPQTRTIN